MGILERIKSLFSGTTVQRGVKIYSIDWSNFFNEWSTSFTVGNHFKGDTHMWYSSENVELLEGEVKMTASYNPNEIEGEVYEYSVGMLHSIQKFENGIFDFVLYKPFQEYNDAKLLFTSEESFEGTNILDFVSKDKFSVVVDSGMSKVIVDGRTVHEFIINGEFMIVLANTLTNDIEDKVVSSYPMSLLSLDVYEIK
jgi:hypothetical protein